MKPNQSDVSRRHFMKLTVTGVAAATLASGARAQAPAPAQPQPLSEEDPTGKALHYVMDATKSTMRTDKTATCVNCMHYKGAADSAEAPCAIFPGKTVHAKGWCSAWVKKP